MDSMKEIPVGDEQLAGTARCPNCGYLLDYIYRSTTRTETFIYRGKEDTYEFVEEGDEEMGAWSCPHCHAELVIADADDFLEGNVRATVSRIAMEVARDSEYVANGGLACPVCGDRGITGGEWNAAAAAAWQEVSCETCGSEWNDCYRLVGIDNLEDGRVAG